MDWASFCSSWIVFSVIYLVWITSCEQSNKRPSKKYIEEATNGEEVVYPYLVDESGNFLTSDLTNHVHIRRKRSYKNSQIHINIRSKNNTFHLELDKNDHLLAPGFKVYRRKGETSQSYDNRTGFGELIATENDSSEDCLYSGRVRSHKNHRTAVTLCDGMRGVIRTPAEDYIIEPIEKYTPHESGNGRRHRIYRRSALEVPKGQFCHKTGPKSQDVKEQSYSSHVINKRSSYRSRSSRRMSSSTKTLETLVVVDKTMYHEHGEDNITTYALTILNMVSEFFLDSSLGKQIHIVLVGLILLEGDEPGLVIQHHADKTLNSFCAWQSVLVGANGRQHDHAILLTGKDICSYKNEPCDTLGFAPIEGMCNRIRSCTINEDTGLSTGFTVTHEMGHNFGMFHDGEGNYCTDKAGYLMSPSLIGKDGKFQWSVCSRAYMLRYLNTAQSTCLDDKPEFVAELKFPDKLPGELYDADVQCKWQFGKTAKLCRYDFGKDICKALWCYRGSKRCETKFLPAAEGTSCGSGMWCIHGKCLKYGHKGPKPINGVWSKWTRWTDCSRSCGGGVRMRERECNDPLPQYGGRNCKGEMQVHKMCNIKDCPNGDDNFYSQQCSAYNKQPFRGWYLKWKPLTEYFDASEPCKLYCHAETYNLRFTIKHTAINGMECNDYGARCVDGKCQKVGCDWVINSDAQLDICGVCSGDNSTCQLVRGKYTEQPRLQSYFPIAVIPKNARFIRIREMVVSQIYFAVRNVYGQYFLNGDRKITWPGIYMLGGAKFYYRRPYNKVETLESNGPLTEDIVLEILVQDRNPGVEYQYTIPKPKEVDRNISQHRLQVNTTLSSPYKTTPLMTTTTTTTTTLPPYVYTWNVSETKCSEACAGGKKSMSVICIRNYKDEVNSAYCDRSKVPVEGVFTCNEQPCRPRWVPGKWFSCSKSCGGGKQKRKVYCRQKISRHKDRKVKKMHCKHLPKPPRKQLCNAQACPSAWYVGKWTKCSATCGDALQLRKVVCRNKSNKGYRKVADSMCNPNKRPNANRPCKRQACSPKKSYNWLVTPWEACSATCGRANQKRKVVCRVKSKRGYHRVNASMCSSVPKPNVTRVCVIDACPPRERYDWTVSAWASCSRTCGEGRRSRYLKCNIVSDSGKRKSVDDKHCKYIPKPSVRMVESCLLMLCPQPIVMMVPRWHASTWFQCSVTCGAGTQHRDVKCVTHSGKGLARGCKKSTKPSTSKMCQMDPCEENTTTCEDKFQWCHLVPQHNVCDNKFYGENCCRSCQGQG